MVFEHLPAGEPPARELIAAMVAEVGGLYGGSLEEDPRSPSATPADFSPPGGACLVGFDEEGTAVSVGGVKRLDDQTAEIKRMYVLPEARGRGAARALLAALEDAARELGYSRVRLDTGRDQPHARALYESAGYVEIADYNGNPYATYWAEREL
jgi:GNAT superfamily N-acetyltransferase